MFNNKNESKKLDNDELIKKFIDVCQFSQIKIYTLIYLITLRIQSSPQSKLTFDGKLSSNSIQLCRSSTNKKDCIDLSMDSRRLFEKLNVS